MIKKLLTKGECVQLKYNKVALYQKNGDIRLFRHNELLRIDGLNTVTYSDPYAKLCFTTMVARDLINSEFGEQNKMHKRVLYIDTDTTFTAYLTAGLILKNNYQTPGDVISNSKDSRSDHNNSNKSMGDDINDESIVISARSIDEDERLVQIFLPSEGRFESLLGDAIASMPEASILIFDSLNSFYNMYPGPWYESETLEESAGANQKPSHSKTTESDEPPCKLKANKKRTLTASPKEKNTNPVTPPQKTTKEIGGGWVKPKSPYAVGRLNHLLSIFIMLLVQHGIYYKVPVLVTSMVRYKKVSKDLWVKAPACGRLLNQKSMVRLSVEMINDSDLSVKIMKHPSIAQQTIVYPNVGISLVNP